ncbi:MAG: hypothetical protein ACPG4T_09220 [Nannocystaceae bacterium]
MRLRSLIRLAGRYLPAVCLLSGILVCACATSSQRQLKRASRDMAKSVGKGDAKAVNARVIPGVRNLVNYGEILGTDERAKKSRRQFEKPLSVQPTAVLFLANDLPVDVVETENGWVFDEDPTDFYSQATPRAALRALVRASRSQRWDVLVRLAPERYRIGLSEEKLALAWTEGEYAIQLAEARDRLALHLADPITADAHEAVLDLGDNQRVYLEREGDRWVVVDF